MCGRTAGRLGGVARYKWPAGKGCGKFRICVGLAIVLVSRLRSYRSSLSTRLYSDVA